MPIFSKDLDQASDYLDTDDDNFDLYHYIQLDF